MLPGLHHARALLAWLLLVGAAVVAALVHGGPAGGEHRAAAAPQSPDGGQLYQRWCASCHATDGTGTTAGPALDEVSVAYLDLTIRTGRMPLADPLRGIRSHTLQDTERQQVVAYLTQRLDLRGEVPDPPSGSATEGREVYAVHCAQCHGAAGGGGLAGDGTHVPEVVGVDGVTIAEAVREGPFQMPSINEQLLPDDELGDLAAFLDAADHPAASPLGITELGRGLATAFALALALTVVGLCVWVSRVRIERPELGEEDDE